MLKVSNSSIDSPLNISDKILDSLIVDCGLEFFLTYHYIHYLLEFLESDESDCLLLGLPDNLNIRKPKGCDFFRVNKKISVIEYSINSANYLDSATIDTKKTLINILSNISLRTKYLDTFFSQTFKQVFSYNYDALLNVCDSFIDIIGLQNHLFTPEYSFKMVKLAFYELMSDYPEKKYSYNITLDNLGLWDIEGLSFMFIDYPGIIADKNFHIILSTALNVGNC